MVIFIAILMLVAPGLVSIRVKWNKKRASKSDFKHILSDYLIFSFTIMVLVFIFIFLADAIRGLSFVDRVFAFSQGVSAGFILNYSVVAIIAAVVLPLRSYIYLQFRKLLEKFKLRFCSITKRINTYIRKHPRNIIFSVVILVLLATSIIVPMTHAASYVPQILIITPSEAIQARLAPDGQEYRENIEIIIAGVHLSSATAIYANNMRVNNVQEITRFADDEVDDNFECENESECVFNTVLYSFENGLLFHLPPIFLEEAGVIEIVAVNNADAIIPARSNPVSVYVRGAEYPEIINVTATHLTDDMRVHLHIYGYKFAPYAIVSINGMEQIAAVVLDEQNIYVVLDTSHLPLKLPKEADDNTDEVTVVVQNSEGIQSEAFILSGITGIGATVVISHTDDWIRSGSGIIASGLGGWDGFANTNSKEAFVYNYGQGFRLFEFQTQFSSDGVLFGIHASIRVPGLTFEQEQERVQYTIMSFEDIVALMVIYDDWQLIIDSQYHNNLYAIENTFEYIINTINRIDSNLIDRIVIQVHNQHMYHFLVNNFPFTAYVYNLQTSSDLDIAVLEFTERTGISAIRMPIDRAMEDFIEMLNELDVSVFISTTNDLLQTSNLFETGITGIFTNLFTPSMRYMTEAQLLSREEELLILQNHREFVSFVSELPVELGDDYIRFISTGTMVPGNIPDSVIDAFQILTDLNFTPIDEYTVNGSLVIDGFQYNYGINRRVITYIVYDKNNSQLLEWVAFDPLTGFERIDFDFHRENNRRYLLEYLENLIHENLIVLMSVNEDASDGLDASILEKLSNLGLRQSLADRFSYSYAAIIDGHTLIYEKLTDERIEHVQVIDRWLVEVQSGGRLAGYISHIMVDGVDYSRNHRGINIVVLNKQTGLIEDSVTFDTHSTLSAYRG